MPLAPGGGEAGGSSPFVTVLNEAYRGTLTPTEMASWVMGSGPKSGQVQQVLDMARFYEPHVNLGFQVVNGQIAVDPNNPATKPLSPGMFGPGGPTNPLPGITGPKVGSGGSGSPGQSDWTNLLIRLAEFGIGTILVIIGFNAIVAKTKAYRHAEDLVATGIGASKIPKV